MEYLLVFSFLAGFYCWNRFLSPHNNVSGFLEHGGRRDVFLGLHFGRNRSTITAAPRNLHCAQNQS